VLAADHRDAWRVAPVLARHLLHAEHGAHHDRRDDQADRLLLPLHEATELPRRHEPSAAPRAHAVTSAG
jgi:hypothetical protein